MKSSYKSIILKLLLLSLGINTSSFSFQSKAEGFNPIIKKFCLESVKSEMLALTNPINAQVAEHTCNCFLKKISSGEKMSSAKEMCKKQTSIEFSL